MKKRFLPMIIGFLFTFFFVNIFAIMIFANEVPSSEDKEYGETKNSIDKYIDGQLDKLDINEIQDYINKEIVINDVNLKSFVKDLISGEKNILDLFNKDGLKILMFDEFKASLTPLALLITSQKYSTLLDFFTSVSFFNFFASFISIPSNHIWYSPCKFFASCIWES